MQGIWVTTTSFLVNLLGPEDEDEECGVDDCADLEDDLDDDLAGDYDVDEDDED